MKSFQRTHTAASLITAVALTLNALAQDVWRDKPFNQWSKEEAEKVLLDSPWARLSARSGAAIYRSVSAPDPAFNFRLRSALPVRQAMLRLRQLREKYDQLSEAKKADFDEKNRPLVECPACADNYVIALHPPPGGREPLPRALLTTSHDRIKLAIYLSNERGERRELIHYVPPKSAASGEAVFFFPRFNEKGKPLLTPANKRLVLNIGSEALGGDQAVNRFEFDVSKMVVNGKVEF